MESKMKKLLLATVTGAAIASGAYVVSQQEKGYTPLPQLDYVPADSIFFWSQLESFPYLNYLDVLPDALRYNYQVTTFVEEMKAQEAELDKNALFLLKIAHFFTICDIFITKFRPKIK